MEGTGKPRSRGDNRRFFYEELVADDQARAEVEKRRIVSRVEVIDAQEKALTGRKPEQYVEESGIKYSELFPKGGKILNIGDPWQTLDIEGATNVDYEGGDEAEFVYDEEKFIASVPGLIESLRDSLRHSDHEEEILSELFKFDFEHIHEEQYENLAQTFSRIKEMIAGYRSISENDELESMYKNTWYTAIKLARGFSDIHLMKTKIQPVLDREMLRRKGLSEGEREEIIAKMITRYRFSKRYKNADLVKGAFPDMPFPDHEFDRFIASWSISTHMFPGMEKSEFNIYWDEIDRLLKRDGVAYIWPIYRGGERELVESFFDYKEQGGDVAVVTYQYDGDEISDYCISWVGDQYFNNEISEAELLIVFPKGASTQVKNNIEEHINIKKAV